MWIFLLILKWIFIILGILLGLVLLFTSLVLCVPVRYRAAGDNREKIQYSFKVSWLLSVVAVKKKKDSEQIVFSVFGIPIKRMGNEKPVKKNVVKSEKGKEPDHYRITKKKQASRFWQRRKKKRNKERTRRRELFPGQKKRRKRKTKKTFHFKGYPV